jgi:3',5'-nucleoside bisphosphate phosphatase
MLVRADLHIHTKLSPCALEDMTPPRIVEAAVAVKLSMIAICDHNSAANTLAVQQAARAMRREKGDTQLFQPAVTRPTGQTSGAGKVECPLFPTLTVLAGMEIETAEEVHVLGIFPDAAAAGRASRQVRPTLRDADDAYYRKFGRQYIVDAAGRTVAMEDKMLDCASGFSLEAAIRLIHAEGGLAIASHADRKVNSVMSQLGLFPTDAGFDAIEVSFHGRPHAAQFEPYGLPVLTDSDSHDPADIGRCFNELDLDEPSFNALAAALKRRPAKRFFPGA